VETAETPLDTLLLRLFSAIGANGFLFRPITRDR
jgi:hypothetical protein